MALRSFQPAVHTPNETEYRRARDAAQRAAECFELCGMDFEAKIAREMRDRAAVRLALLVAPSVEEPSA